MVTTGNYHGYSILYHAEISLKIKEKDDAMQFKVSGYDRSVKVAVDLETWGKISKELLNGHERFQVCRKDSYLNFRVREGVIQTLTARNGCELTGFHFARHKLFEPRALMCCHFVLVVIALAIRFFSNIGTAHIVKLIKCPVFDFNTSFSYEINNDYFYKIQIKNNSITCYITNKFDDVRTNFDKILYKDLLAYQKNLSLYNIMPYTPGHEELHTPFDMHVEHIHVEIGGIPTITPEIFEFLINSCVSAKLLSETTGAYMINDFKKSSF